MLVTVEIKSCRNCRFIDHSGSFTIGGARDICGHSDACKKRYTIKEFLKEYPKYSDRDLTHWKFHWYHRVLTDSSDEIPKGIPDWCPLKHGASY